MTFTAAGRKCAVTAGGKVLGNIHNLKSIHKAWDAWKALPESERTPGVVKVGDDRPIAWALEPPASALVLRTYTRQLERGKDGSLRYPDPGDYPEPEPAGTRSGTRCFAESRGRNADNANRPASNIYY